MCRRQTIGDLDPLPGAAGRRRRRSGVQTTPRQFSDGPLGRLGLIVRGHGLDAPVQEPLRQARQGIRVLVVNADYDIGDVSRAADGLSGHRGGGYITQVALPGGTIPSVEFYSYVRHRSRSNHAYVDRVAMEQRAGGLRGRRRPS